MFERSKRSISAIILSDIEGDLLCSSKIPQTTIPTTRDCLTSSMISDKSKTCSWLCLGGQRELTRKYVETVKSHIQFVAIALMFQEEEYITHLWNFASFNITSQIWRKTSIKSVLNILQYKRRFNSWRHQSCAWSLNLTYVLSCSYARFDQQLIRCVIKAKFHLLRHVTSNS